MARRYCQNAGCNYGVRSSDEEIADELIEIHMKTCPKSKKEKG